MSGQNNFDRIRYEYFRDRQVAFEAFKTGAINFHEEYTSRIWATGYDFPGHARRPRQARDPAGRRRRPACRAGTSTLRRDKFKDPRMREAIGLAFDFEWTNQNIMFGAYKRTASYFENSRHEGDGQARRPEELALLEPFRGKAPGRRVRGALRCRPKSDGSGQDRTLLRQADELLRAAGCKREGSALKLPSGEPFDDRVPRLPDIAAAAHAAVHQESGASRHSSDARASSMPRSTSAAWTISIST